MVAIGRGLVSGSLISSTFELRNAEALEQIAPMIVAASKIFSRGAPFAPQHLGEEPAIGRPSAIGR